MDGNLDRREQAIAGLEVCGFATRFAGLRPSEAALDADEVDEGEKAVGARKLPCPADKPMSDHQIEPLAREEFEAPAPAGKRSSLA